MFKFLLTVTLAIGGGVFNLLLYLDKEGVNVSSERSDGGWKTACKYYTPVRFFVVEVDTGTSCPSRVVIR